MYFEIPASMGKLQEVIYLFAICISLIKLSRCGSFVTVTEDEAVQLEFPYPCDSNKVTIQSANRVPFYSSTDTASLHLPAYQLRRFSVTDGNCSVQVEINPVNRNDEATYISQAYRDGAIQSELTRIRLNVNYPPGDASCTFSINDYAVGNWLPLQCTAHVGSLAGEIYCYQDSKRLPPRGNLVQIGENLKQTVWVSKESHPVFCCSASLDKPKDICECKDFVWDPMGDISQTNITKDPCPATTPGLVVTLSQYPKREVKDNSSQLSHLTESLNLTDTNMSTADITAKMWVGVIAIIILEIAAAFILVCLYVVEKNKKQSTHFQSNNAYQQITMVENELFSTNSQENNEFIHYRSSNKHSMARSRRRKSW